MPTEVSVEPKKYWLSLIAANWQLALLSGVAIDYGIFQGLLHVPSSEYVGAGALLLLTLLMIKDAFPCCDRTNKTRSSATEITAWVVILSGIAILLIPAMVYCSAGRPMALLIILLSAVCWFNEWASMLRMAVPFGLAILVMPFREQLILTLSYPLRLISTMLAGETLLLIGADIRYVQTSLHLQATEIAITDACSGIQQVEAMVLVAFWLVCRENKTLFWKTAHYLFLFPAIIIANTLRILLTIGLFQLIGMPALGAPVHISLGYLQVVLALAILYFGGMLIPDRDNNSGNRTRTRQNTEKQT